MVCVHLICLSITSNCMVTCLISVALETQWISAELQATESSSGIVILTSAV
uniref:Uncharacterized protein n=1 Tax=Anguilla anguilla TaxID=7936 RepID=A0A0E9RC64_ANGAN